MKMHRKVLKCGVCEPQRGPPQLRTNYKGRNYSTKKKPKPKNPSMAGCHCTHAKQKWNKIVEIYNNKKKKTRTLLEYCESSSVLCWPFFLRGKKKKVDTRRKMMNVWKVWTQWKAKRGKNCVERRGRGMSERRNNVRYDHEVVVIK